MISLAYDLAEQKLRDGTASSQLICHYLKLATQREKLEIERLRKENELVEAKTEGLKSQRRVEELYDNAINAMRRYGGGSNEEDSEIF